MAAVAVAFVIHAIRDAARQDNRISIRGFSL